MNHPEAAVGLNIRYST